MGRMKSLFYTLLLVSPACLALELQHATPQQSSVGRQFSDDEIVNYFGWGFIAGLMDYFIRQQFAVTTTTTTNATATAVKAVADTEGDVAETEAEDDDAVIEVAGAMVEQVKKVRNKKKQKKKKKKTQKMMEIENQMEEDDLDDATVNV